MTSRIIVIDDDITALDLVDILFEQEGFEVVRYPDGSSALADVQKANPDVILIDLMMPHMAGQECVRRMRQQGIEAPIVAFTALDDPQVHQEARDAGCSAVIVKPCKSKDLVRKIEALITRNEK